MRAVPRARCGGGTARGWRGAHSGTQRRRAEGDQRKHDVDDRQNASQPVRSPPARTRARKSETSSSTPPSASDPLPGSEPAQVHAGRRLAPGGLGRPRFERAPRRLDRVRQQHRARHRPDPARHRRDRARHLAHGVEVHVARRGRRRCGWCPRRSPWRPRAPCRRVTRPGEPTAAISTSASRQTAARSRVREWQWVTVALAASSSWASGLPTRIERPSTTARAPSSSAPASASSSITPGGRAGHHRRRGPGSAARRWRG